MRVLFGEDVFKYVPNKGTMLPSCNQYRNTNFGSIVALFFGSYS